MVSERMLSLAEAVAKLRREREHWHCADHSRSERDPWLAENEHCSICDDLGIDFEQQYFHPCNLRHDDPLAAALTALAVAFEVVTEEFADPWPLSVDIAAAYNNLARRVEALSRRQEEQP